MKSEWNVEVPENNEENNGNLGRTIVLVSETLTGDSRIL
jgi:hypothetical protein